MRILCKGKCSPHKKENGFECFPPDVQSLSRHAKKHHQEQLEKKDGILRRTEVEDPIVARFLRESHGQGPILVNATKKAIKVNFRSTRLNAMKTEDANAYIKAKDERLLILRGLADHANPNLNDNLAKIYFAVIESALLIIPIIPPKGTT